MARSTDGTLIDPHGGRRDLEARVLRLFDRLYDDALEEAVP